MIDPTATIHSQAMVDTRVTIGARTQVWQFASVIRGAVLGDDCVVAPGAMLDGPKFGDRCLIGPHAALGPGFLIGDDVFVGPGVIFCNDAWPRADKDGFNVSPFQDGFYTVIVGNGASIGAGAILLPGVSIGERAMIAAGAVVDRHVEADRILYRNGMAASITDEHLHRIKRMRIIGGSVD